MVPRDELRRYTIQPNGLYFDAGHLPDGTPVLIGVQQPECVMVRFNDDGTMHSIETYSIHGDVENSFEEWKRAIGFNASPISVRQFYDQERWIGIRDLPDHYQEVLDHPQVFDEHRKEPLEEDIRQWLARGDFVLYWDEEYYLNRDGEVESD